MDTDQAMLQSSVNVNRGAVRWCRDASCDLLEQGVKEGLMDTTALIDGWVQALQADGSAVRDLVADDVVLHSPLTNVFTFTGPDHVCAVLGAASDLIRDIRVHTRLADHASAVLIFSGTVNGAAMEETQLLRFSAAGLVKDITIMGRPLPALLHVMRSIPAGLVARGVMPPAARPAAVALGPMVSLLTAIDTHLAPRLPPNPPRH